MIGKIKQFFCRHRYADNNLDIVEINHYTDIVRLKNYCIKCGKPYEVKFSYTHMFGEVDAEIKKQITKSENKANGFFTPEDVRKMTKEEVRQNYKEIRDSMKKW